MRLFLAIILGVLPQFAVAQVGVERLELTQEDPACICVKLLSNDSISAKEITVHGHDFQVFTDNRSGNELFRIEFGRTIEGNDVRYWHYGLSAIGDFNGDGKPDYAWYGGDDAGYSLYVLFSEGTHYRKMDAVRSLLPFAKKRLGKISPDMLGGDFVIQGPWLERKQGKLWLAGTVSSDIAHKNPVTIRLPKSNFVFVK